jgi:ZIP family zinc transporter
VPQAPILQLLVLAVGAVCASLFGVVPFQWDRRTAARGTGAANAVAGGLMLGASYILLAPAMQTSGLAAVLGAGLGVGYTRWTHWYTGTKPSTRRGAATEDAHFPDRVLLLNALHASAEGLAIGMAALVSAPMGMFVAATLAVHNVAEAMVLTELLQAAGVGTRRVYSLSVLTRAPQVLVAVAGYAVLAAIPGSLAWGLGFAAGALLYLVLTELLPAAYERSGQGPPALLVTVLAGMVLLLQALLV